MARKISPIWFAVAALAQAGLSGRASAQEPSTETEAQDEARAQFDAGVALFDEGQFAQASVAFERAYELRPSFKILYNLAQAENELGRFAAALFAFERYLAEGGDQIDAARREEVSAEIARLGTLVGTIAVEAGTEGLTVFVDGRKIGATPLGAPLPTELGEHEVRLARGAQEVYREIVKLAGGQHAVVKVETAPVSPGPTDLSPDPQAERGGREETGARGGEVRPWTWVAFCVGGASAIAAGVTGGLYTSRVNDVKGRCDGSDCPTTAKSDADAAETLGDVTTALVAVAGVGIAAGIVLYFVEPELHADAKIEVAPTAAVSKDTASLALVGRF
jgi:tetratricopeptide (TPR) repeat protein